MKPFDDAAASVLDHTLIGIDAGGYLCACRTKSESGPGRLEHLAAIAMLTVDAPPEHRSNLGQRRTILPDPLQLRVRQIVAMPDLERVRAILRDENAYQEALGAELERLGLTSFTQRAAWLERRRNARIARLRKQITTTYDRELLAS